MKTRRRSFFSNPREQAKIIAVFTFLAVAFGSVNCYVSRQAVAALRDGLATVAMTGASRTDVAVLFRQVNEDLTSQLVLFNLLVAAVLIAGSIYLSHKIGGPIAQLRNYFAAVARGDMAIRAIRFRRGDFFHDLAANFNEFQRSRNLLPPEPPGTDANDAKR